MTRQRFISILLSTSLLLVASLGSVLHELGGVHTACREDAASASVCSANSSCGSSAGCGAVNSSSRAVDVTACNFPHTEDSCSSQNECGIRAKSGVASAWLRGRLCDLYRPGPVAPGVDDLLRNRSPRSFLDCRARLQFSAGPQFGPPINSAWTTRCLMLLLRPCTQLAAHFRHRTNRHGIFNFFPRRLSAGIYPR